MLPMALRHSLLHLLALAIPFTLSAQEKRATLPTDVQAELIRSGFLEQDLADMVEKDNYTTEHNGVRHMYLRQRWQGIEVWNGDIAIHRGPNNALLKVNNGAAPFMAKRVNTVTPKLTSAQALASVWTRTMPGLPVPQLMATENGGKRDRYDGTNTSGIDVLVELYFVAAGNGLRLAWNVNHYTPDGTHWWNVRIDAETGAELERNDWVSQCAFDIEHDHAHVPAEVFVPEAAPAPLAPNDYNVFAWPLESPSHGSRTLQNAPWLAGGIASPFGWHDTNGAAGAEHTITKGNNVQAQEDADANNTGGFSPNGGATLDFDFPINFTQTPVNYQSAAITNLFYWNNLMHDVWYKYGFTETSGNFQQNNYGRGGLGNDFVLADALDGSGTNNANFGTPPDGSNPRMQMYVWTPATPDRTSDLDNGVIAHEYGHGISNRLVGGPSNVSCLGNAEQMGEGWSDYFGLVMTLKAGDVGTDGRGIGTYVQNQATTGAGIRPARYSTSFGVNNYTYASTNNTSLSQPHGIGFVWCTMLWEMTWELIGVYGLDPDIYNGTGGNNIAMQLVIDGLKLTPCNPGFVDGRDAILLADQINNGGANQAYIWAAFARRGLGASATQGSTSNRTDQTEAYDTPVPNNVGVASIVAPATELFSCPGLTTPVVVQIRNSGSQPQSNFPVSYSVNGGAPVTETFTGTIGSGALATFTFNQTATLAGNGPFSVAVTTGLTGDQLTSNDQLTRSVSLLPNTTVTTNYVQDVESGSATPTGWIRQNPDNGITWGNTLLTNGALCASSRAWSIDFYNYGATNQEDRLISPTIDLSASAGTRLKFHHAYVIYSSGYEDRMRVEVSPDCGATWNTVFDQSGTVLATAPPATSAWTPSNCSQWRLTDIDLSAYDGGSILVRFTAINGYGNFLYLDNVTIENNGVKLALDMLLEGPYVAATGLMRDDLRAAGQIPLLEPYTGLGFTQAGNGGGESISATVLTTTGNDAIVDWVLVELRSATTPTTIVATRAALLQRDGDVVDKDGTSPLTFMAAPGNYHVAVRHRNHLGCMTNTFMALTGSPTALDLTVPSTITFGTEGQKTIDARTVLWAGNVIRDNNLIYTGTDNDRDAVLQAIGGIIPTNTSAVGYHAQDVNMDGVIRYTGENNDRDPILTNIGGVVPTLIRPERLP